MFYEARRGDKEALSRMKDGVRRAHRRKHFYENVRKGPEQFLHIQGLKATIHTDVTISRAAEAGNILRCWQGDPDVTIDRFDARSLIDHIPEPRKNVEFTSLEEKEEMVCNYERYRLLVLFDFRRDSEKTILHEIAAKERWSEQAEEKKTAFKRKRHENHTQGVQFVYEDSEIVGGGCDNEEEGSDVAEEEGMKHKFDSTTFSYSTEAQKLANSIAEAYGVKNGHFVALVHVDEKAQKDAEELARIDKEKRRQTGPGGNLVRQQLRKQADTIIRRGQSEEATLKLSLLRKEEKQEEKESSSSEEEKAPETEFILSFGGEEEGERRRGKENRKGGSSRKDRRSPSPRRRRSRSTSKHRGRESSPRREGRERRRRRSRSTSRRRRWESPKSEGPERSSMSDSEKERIEIENRKRRVKRTKRMVKAKQQAAGKERRQEGEGKTDVEKVKKIMQKSLRKTMEEMKEEEDEKKREHRKEQRVREELNFLAEQERRLRRREKMRQEREGRERSRSCDSTTDRNLFRG